MDMVWQALRSSSMMALLECEWTRLKGVLGAFTFCCALLQASCPVSQAAHTDEGCVLSLMSVIYKVLLLKKSVFPCRDFA